MQKYKDESKIEDFHWLTIKQLYYLYAIRDTEGVTFKQLTEEFKVQKSTVTDFVNRMVQRGLVMKKQSGEDLRVYHIYLTAKGRELLEIEYKGYHHFVEKMTRCLDDEEKEVFRSVLEKIATKLRD